MKHKIYGSDLPNIPFEPRPDGLDSPLWRYSKNPIINKNPFPNASRVFNSAVMAYKGEFIGVFRADTKTAFLIYLSVIRKMVLTSTLKKSQSSSTIRMAKTLN